MEHFEQPERARSGAAPHQTKTAAPKPTGWRKASAGLVAANHLADQGCETQADKSRALVAVKRVAAHLGLKPADLLLLDTLAAFTQSHDWEEGQRPIVWASNAYLMAQTGFSLSTLKRHARRLAEEGLIAFRDSPNGKRWGRRDADGRITEAYGFDLSPLGARMAEFEALSQELRAEQALCRLLRGQITTLRRTIRAHLDALKGDARGNKPLCACEEQFIGLLEQLPGPRAASAILSDLVEAFGKLVVRVEALFTPVETGMYSGEKLQNMDPTVVTNGPHIRITNQDNPVTRNSSENEERAETLDPHPETHIGDEQQSNKSKLGIDVPLILQSCPEYANWCKSLEEPVQSWPNMVRAADQLRAMVGISNAAWQDAQHKMGSPTAAAALALIVEKTHSGEIRSPGGYLRGMVEKAAAGALHLERSFFGRLGGLAA